MSVDDRRERTVTVALAGLGAIGLGAHLPALLRHSRVRVAALVDPDQERAKAVPSDLDVPVLPDVAEVLEDASVEGVVLATPPWVTTGLLEQVVAAGRFVLAEKPLAVSTRAAAGLARLPEWQRALVQAGLTYRHDPALELLRDWITAGRLGGPLLIRAHVYDERRSAEDPWHAAGIERTLAHGMPVVHEGAHVFDWFRYLLGTGPQRVEDAWALGTRPGLANPNLCGARLSYPDGSVVLADFGWLTEALPRCEISLLGDRGHALLDGYTFGLRLVTGAPDVEQVDFEPDRATRCFDRQVQRFVELVAGESPRPEPDLDDGLTALELAERVAALAVGELG